MAQKAEDGVERQPNSDGTDEFFLSSLQQGADKNMLSDKNLECPVCLQTCIHPVMLPCKHIFCFLCIKGVANQSKRCALCRREIPQDFLNNPLLIKKEELAQSYALEDGKQWFYEGRQGWWQYDERTTTEMEERFKAGVKQCEILIAGFLYVIDFEQMLQFRRNDHTRRRRIKRDFATAPKKGVAGLKIAGSDGNVQQQDGDANRTDAVAPAAPPDSVTNSTLNTAQEEPTNEVSPSDEDLTATMASLTLNGASRHLHHDHRHYFDMLDPSQSPQRTGYSSRTSRLLLETPSSSDSDWD